MRLSNARFGRCRHAGIANTATYRDVCRFQVFVALCDHNPPTSQTDRRTDRQTETRTDIMLVALAFGMLR